MRALRQVFAPVVVDARIIEAAIAADFADFEDAVQYQCALRAKSSVLLTRNLVDFPKSPLQVTTPELFLHQRSL